MESVKVITKPISRRHSFNFHRTFEDAIHLSPFPRHSYSNHRKLHARLWRRWIFYHQEVDIKFETNLSRLNITFNSIFASQTQLLRAVWSDSHSDFNGRFVVVHLATLNYYDMAISFNTPILGIKNKMWKYSWIQLWDRTGTVLSYSKMKQPRTYHVENPTTFERTERFNNFFQNPF